MEIDQKTASDLGFPKPEYVAVERERRWLCREIPRERIVQTEAITDLYVTGARLRLREARPIDGGAPRLRLSRKVDVDPQTRLITSIYLPEEEFAVLAASLPGRRIMKLRHRLRPLAGAAMAVDEFQGDLDGLILAEAEFETPDLLAAFPTPDFAVREVTEDPRFTGSALVRSSPPQDLWGGRPSGDGASLNPPGVETQIRDAAPSDTRALSALLEELGYVVSPESAAERIRDSRGEVLVAVVGDTLAGLISWVEIPLLAEGGCFVRVTGLCVSGQHRGQGIGRRLIGEVQIRARSSGASLIEVSSGRRPERSAAHRFYSALGFADSAGDSVLYRKSL